MNGDGSEQSILRPTSRLIVDNLPPKRKKLGLAYAEGERTVELALTGSWMLKHLFLEKSYAYSDSGRNLTAEARKRSVPCSHASKEALQKLSSCDTAPPCGVLLSPPGLRASEVLESGVPILILDRISDPGNAGTLIRSSSAFGFTTLLTRGSVSLLNEKLIRSSAGTCFLKDVVCDGGAPEELASILSDSHYVVYTMDPRALQTIRSVAIRTDSPMALVLGSEVSGIDSHVWNNAIGVRIPMQDNVESLNVAMSGSIALYEFAQKAHP